MRQPIALNSQNNSGIPVAHMLGCQMEPHTVDFRKWPKDHGQVPEVIESSMLFYTVSHLPLPGTFPEVCIEKPPLEL